MPLLATDVIQDGNVLPTLPLVTVTGPGKLSGPPGGRMLIPTRGCPRAGGPVNPLAQQGRWRMHSLHVRLKTEIADLRHAGFPASVADASFWRRLLDALWL